MMSFDLRSALRTARRFGLSLLVLVALAATGARAQQPLETETARLPPRGMLLTSLTYEFQTSPQGTEHAAHLAFEYGISNRVALVDQAVLYRSSRATAGRSRTGV